MAAGSLLALLDDIATVLDDVAILSKVAAKKTAGVLGDDLALNAEQVSGVRADREIPVVWAVAKGSFKNKLILVPAALLISALANWLIAPLLMLGGAFLCFEGFEKIAHRWLHPAEDQGSETKAVSKALLDPKVDMVDFEKNKIKGAIRTDFILSAEIIVIALGTVQEATFFMQVMTVSTIALLITIGVYGLVALIVKIDDAGFYLVKQESKSLFAQFKVAIGRGLLIFAPFLMKALTIIGTAAMFLVGGGIIMHGLPPVESLSHHIVQMASNVPTIGSLLAALTPTVNGGLLGIIVGGLLVSVFTVGSKFFSKSAK